MLGVSRCEENVPINMRLMRPAGESSAFSWIHWDMAPGIRQLSSRVAVQKRLKTSSLWMKWHLTFCCVKGSKKNQNNGLWVQDFCWVFSRFINHVPFIGVCSKKPQMEHKEEAQRDEMRAKFLRRGWLQLGGEHRCGGSATAQGWSGFRASQVQRVCCVTNSGKILWCHFMHRN